MRKEDGINEKTQSDLRGPGSGLRNRRVASFLVMSAAFFLIATMQNCQKSSLTPLEEQFEMASSTNTVSVNFCTDPAYDQKQYLKTIIILDHSGSNQQNYKMAADGSGAPALVGNSIIVNSSYATDPNGLTRYGSTATPGTLLNYLSTLPANDPTDPTRFFALIDFNSQASTYPANASGFTSDTVDFYNHVLDDATNAGNAPVDGGSTSYLSALAKAYSILQADIQSAKACAALAVGSNSPGAWCPVPGRPNASSYVVVFMSDGSPITELSGVGVDGAGNVVVTGDINIKYEATADILGEVSAINALSSNAQYVASVNLFTIYYYKPGNVDTNGQTLLANMAKAGNGVTYNALSGSNIDYSQFQPPAKRIKYTLSDIFVTNSSVNWWTDGQLHKDTDLDGLPDDVEVAWGSDPTKVSTDKNGVSDLVKYRLSSGAACGHKNASGICTDTPINYKSGVCKSISNTTTALGVKFKSSDPDGLNDCEKTLLANGAGIGLADSNGDSIPDWLEFKSGLPFQAGTSPAINQVNQEGYSQYQKVKLSLPQTIPLSELIYTPPVYALTQVSTNDIQDCYSLQVTNMPLIGDSNTIRVDVIEKTPQLPLTPLYRLGTKSFAPGASNLIFSDWKNAIEMTSGTWKVSPL